jgi:carbon monoxide dehydrogenase subunit G
MASIIRDTVVRAPAATVWDALSNVGAAHRVFAGVLSDCRLEGENTRIATFTNGLIVTERIISIDAERKRVAYTLVSGGFEHHGASMQVFTHDEGACRFVWTTDVLPDAAADRIRPLMDAGIAALKRTFDSV